MMTDKQVELLRKMFAHSSNPPEITLERDYGMVYDEPVILIDKGVWQIREDKVDGPPSIRTKQQVDGFVLENATYQPATRYYPEEYDYAEVAADQRFEIVAKHAVTAYVTHCINDMLAGLDQAAELELEQQQLIQAKQEGHNAKNYDNPYPHGTAPHYAWEKGYDEAEYEQLKHPIN